MTIATQERQAGRRLIAGELFGRLTARIATDPEIDEQLAARICDQTLAFLKACADNPQVKLSPSEMVDIGWHAFLLYTRDYTEFCEHIAGRFIHHVPENENQRSDTRGAEPASCGAGTCAVHSASGQGSSATVADSVRAIEASGFAVDAELWFGPHESKCSQCYRGCHDS